MGKRIQTPEGEGKIIRYNLIRETVTLELEDKRELEVALKDLTGGDTPAETNEGA